MKPTSSSATTLLLWDAAIKAARNRRGPQARPPSDFGVIRPR